MAGNPDRTTRDVMSGVDLRGRRALVTGACGGLGLETARTLAQAGARVLFADIDADRGGQVVAETGGDARFRRLDLSSMAEVRAFCAALLAEDDGIDLLVNNAGVVRGELQRTVDGFEMTLATNFLGHFLLTGRLMPLLRRGSGARIVNLSSGAQRDSPVHWDDPHYRQRPYLPREAYAQSKSATALFTAGLTSRLAGTGVNAFTVRPAVADTGIFAALSDDQRAHFSTRVKARRPGRPVEIAAATSVWACVAPELDAAPGSYLAECGVVAGPHRLGPPGSHAEWIFDPDAAERLWRLAEHDVGERFDWSKTEESVV